MKKVLLCLLLFSVASANAQWSAATTKWGQIQNGGGAAAPFTLGAPTPGDVPLTLKGASGQTANLLTVKDSNDNALTYLYADGGLHAYWLEVDQTGQTDGGVFVNYSGYLGTDSGLTWGSTQNVLSIGNSGDWGVLNVQEVGSYPGTKLVVTARQLPKPQNTGAIPGIDVEVYAESARADYYTLGAARGGDIKLTAGSADRLGTGDARGGIIQLTPGYGRGSGVDGTVRIGNLQTFADNAAATAGGLVAGDLYRTSTGVLMVRY